MTFADNVGCERIWSAPVFILNPATLTNPTFECINVVLYMKATTKLENETIRGRDETTMGFPPQ